MPDVKKTVIFQVFTFLHGGWGSSGSNSNSNAATPLSASSGSGGDRWKADGKGGASGSYLVLCYSY